jgi:heme-degrading monooxygenase HmoA
MRRLTTVRPVTFINCFEVPAGREDEFFSLWSEVNRYMRTRPGYLSHRLHRAILPGARFSFVNVAQWASTEAWQAAHDDGFRALVSQPVWADFPPSGSLFDIVSESHLGLGADVPAPALSSWPSEHGT